jgi:hypothetical protein
MMRRESPEMTTEWKKAQAGWRSLAEAWTDSTRQRFERDFWDDYSTAVSEVIRGTEEAETIVSDILAKLV